MARTLTRLLLTLALIALGAATAPAAAPAAANSLLAQESDNAFWVVSVSTPRGGREAAPQTYVRYRVARGGDWQALDPLPGTVAVSLANDHEDLIVVLADGSWRRVGPGRFVAGAPLPGENGHVLAIASRADDLWAVGFGRIPTDRPATPAAPAATAPTTNAAATSRAATAPVPLPVTSVDEDGPLLIAPPTVPVTLPAPAAEPGPLRLWHFVANGWVYAADLPPAVPADPDRFSFSIFFHPILAYVAPDGTVHTLRFSPPAAPATTRSATGPATPISADAGEARPWQAQEWGDVRPPFVPQQIKLLATPLKAALWVAPPTRPMPPGVEKPTTVPATAASEVGPAGLLYFRNESWSAPQLLTVQGASFIPTRRAIAAGGDDVRLILLSDDNGREKLWEQTYAMTTGDPTRPLAPLPDVKINRAWGAQMYVQLIVSGLVMLVMFAALTRRRPAPDPARLAEQWDLAPLHSRLMAGLIDFLPVGVALALYQPMVGNVPPTALTAATPHFMAWFWTLIVMWAVYLLHTTLGELLTGRTAGKALFGLRVVGVDGLRAKPGPIVFRNVLRLMDVAFWLLPLTLIFFSPLRQRVGDAAAGTVVVVPKTGASVGDEQAGTEDDAG